MLIVAVGVYLLYLLGSGLARAEVIRELLLSVSFVVLPFVMVRAYVEASVGSLIDLPAFNLLVYGFCLKSSSSATFSKAGSARWVRILRPLLLTVADCAEEVIARTRIALAVEKSSIGTISRRLDA